MEAAVANEAVEVGEIGRPGWYRALTLDERVRGLRQGERPAAERERARRRFERWRGGAHPEVVESLERRLAAHGLGRDDFLDLLGEPPEALRARQGEVPAWLRSLSSAFAAAVPEAAGGRRSTTGVFTALVEEGCRRLRREVRRLLGESGGGLCEPRTVHRLFLPILLAQLTRTASRTISLELQVARLEGPLPGDTPEERFQGFLARFARPEAALALLSRYPVLARQLVESVDRWVAFAVDVLRHLAEDREVLERSFGAGAGLGAVTAVEGSGSDLHRHGRSVLFLDFEAGLRLVYKPKSLAAEVRFQELLGWCNRCGFEPGLRTLTVVDRGDHGWVEHAAAGECADEPAEARFYERLGGLLSLLSLLEATDFHHENLVAAGEQPVLVDLETLFHPDLTFWGDGEGDATVSLYPSLLRIGLLPERVWRGEDGSGVDISGLAAEPGQLSSSAVPLIDGDGTDEMRFVRRRAEIPLGGSRARRGGELVDPSRHVESLVSGYRRMYRLLLRHRAELLAPRGPLAAFAGAEVRVIVRPTRSYGILLTESVHPHVLQDGLDRERILEHLWLGVRDRPHLAPLVPAELRSLLRGDVPVFTTRPDSRDLECDDGARLPGFLPDTGLERIARRVETLDEADLARDVELIRDSVATVPLSRREQPWPRLAPAPAEPPPAERLVAAAEAVGERLAAEAHHGNGQALWFELKPVDGSRWWSHHPVGVDLYGGLGGIALFLAHLGRLTGESRFTGLARDAWSTARLQLRQAPELFDAVGAFGGWGSVLYTSTHLGLLWRDEALLDHALAVTEALPRRIAKDEVHDVIGGSAGCLLALLALHRQRPAAALLDCARLCGERLLASAREVPNGAGWLTRGAGDRPLTGLSHGTAGIAWALLELAEAVGDERFRSLAGKALAYERAHFSAAESNWPDLRETGSRLARSHGAGGDSYMVAWCHGAPGIGLARTVCLPWLDPEETRREIAAAVKTTLRRGMDGNHSLCHGALGNLELLLAAAPALGAPELADRARGWAGGLLRTLEEGEPLYGAPLGARIPGLMLGLAGIGYGLLRLAAPDEVPSVLLLETPGGRPRGGRR